MSFETFKKCQMISKKSANLTKLGFDFSNPNLEEEYLKVQSLLVSRYFIGEGSMLTIMKEFDIPSTRTMDILFREFDIKSRSLSDSALLSIEKMRSDPLKNYNSFVHIWHTTWDNKRFHLRSSLEELFAKQLDAKKVPYEIEALRLKYFDTSSNSWKIAIPDFYLPKQNKIVEVKSTYWLDEAQMKCKRNAYRDLGYKFDLFLNGELIPNW